MADAALRALELNAYAAVLAAFRAQGTLTWEKEETLTALRRDLYVDPARHQAEMALAAADERLAWISIKCRGPRPNLNVVGRDRETTVQRSQREAQAKMDPLTAAMRNKAPFGAVGVEPTPTGGLPAVPVATEATSDDAAKKKSRRAKGRATKRKPAKRNTRKKKKVVIDDPPADGEAADTAAEAAEDTGAAAGADAEATEAAEGGQDGAAPATEPPAEEPAAVAPPAAPEPAVRTRPRRNAKPPKALEDFEEGNMLPDDDDLAVAAAVAASTVDDTDDADYVPAGAGRKRGAGSVAEADGADGTEPPAKRQKVAGEGTGPGLVAAEPPPPIPAPITITGADGSPIVFQAAYTDSIDELERHIAVLTEHLAGDRSEAETAGLSSMLAFYGILIQRRLGK